MVSKELLSAVLPHYYHVESDGKVGYDSIQFKTSILDALNNKSFSADNINIYELAHKCKEWAWANGFSIYSGQDEDDIFDADIFLSEAVNDSLHVEHENFDSNSESEAIFKACQWILDNKVSK